MVSSSRVLPATGDLIVMTPIVQGCDENVARVQRYQSNEKVPDDVLHVAGGEHTGIIVRAYSEKHRHEETGDKVPHLALPFNAFIVNETTGIHKEERRELSFYFYDEYDHDVRHQAAQDFFKQMLANSPKNYIGFIKRVLKLLQTGFESVRRIDVDMRIVQQEVEQAPVPMDLCDNSSEVETVIAAHVQDVLENAYPSALTIQAIAEALRCTEDEVLQFLLELQEREIVMYVEETKMWIRYDKAQEAQKTLIKSKPKEAVKDNEKFSTFFKPAANNTSTTSPGGSPSRQIGANLNATTTNAHKTTGDRPTIAIITALFVEKLAVDAIIENKQTMHRYKTDGESNVYTIGTIGGHHVVATKLSAVGHTRVALTAAGSITTRLLGNFQDIEHVFVVGVGGGVAHYTDGEKHVRLGDVVVSSGAHAYTFCDGLELDRTTGQVVGFKFKQYSQKDKIATQVLTSDDCKSGTPMWSNIEKQLEPELNSYVRSSQDYSFSRPPAETDTLNVALGDGNVASVPHPNAERCQPRLHLGGVAGGLSILRSGDQENGGTKLRDEFAARFGVTAFDADFDSVVDSVHGNRIDSWAMIRGVADYGDGMRNKQWQAYAALQAACVAREIILRLPKE